MKSPSYIHAVLILRESSRIIMKKFNKHPSCVFSSTFVGLFCGLGLTHQQAYAVQMPSISNQDNQITAVSVPDNNVTIRGDQKGQRYATNVLKTLMNQDQAWNEKPAFDSTVNMKAVGRIINVHNPDGTLKSKKQTAIISQKIKNNADGTQTIGPWSTAQWQAYAVPEIAGYTANPTQIASQTVTENTMDQTVDVYYEPILQQITVNYLDNGKIVGTQILTGYAGESIIPQYRVPRGYEIIDRPQGQVTFTTAKQQIIPVSVKERILTSSETKSLIRTVNIHFPSGSIKSYRQLVILTRMVYINAVSGVKNYGRWSMGNWDAFTVPVIAGYTASQSQVAAQQVTEKDTDQMVDVYYAKA